MSEDGILVSKTTFWLRGRVYPKGTTVRVGHPILKGLETLFEPLVVDFEHVPPPSNRHSARKSEEK